MKATIWLLSALVTHTTSCASLPYDTGGQIPGTSNPGSEPGSTIPNVRGKATQSASREICRGSAMPRGWVAVDYVSSSGGCRNRMRDAGANTAIIVRYATLPLETISCRLLGSAHTVRLGARAGGGDRRLLHPVPSEAGRHPDRAYCRADPKDAGVTPAVRHPIILCGSRDSRRFPGWALFPTMDT